MVFINIQYAINPSRRYTGYIRYLIICQLPLFSIIKIFWNHFHPWPPFWDLNMNSTHCLMFLVILALTVWCQLKQNSLVHNLLSSNPFSALKCINGERRNSFLVSLGNQRINPLHPNMSIDILYTVLYVISYNIDKENLFDDQELLQLVNLSQSFKMLSLLSFKTKMWDF